MLIQNQVSDRNPIAESRRDLAIAGCLCVALFAFYLATSSGMWPYSDGGIYISVGEGIVSRGSPTQGDYGPDASWDQVLTGQVKLIGEKYTKYPLGQSLLEIPGLLLIRALKPGPVATLLILNMVPALECALMAALLFLLARLPYGRAGEPLLARRVAVMLALGAGVGTQLWPSAMVHFADTSAALLLFAAFYLVMRYRRAGAGEGLLIAAAWAVGYAYFCKNTYVLTWPALGCYGAWAMWRRRKAGGHVRAVRTALLSALPLALAIGGQLWFNHLRYGSIWQGGYHESRDGKFGFNTPLWVGLHGILFSPGCSLFVYSPLCVLAFFGWRRMARWMPAELALAAGSTVPLTLTYARWWSWHGGWEWGTRFFLFLVPMLLWLSIPAWKWLERPRWWAAYKVRTALLGVVLGVGVCIQILGVSIEPSSTWTIMAYDMRVLQYGSYEQGVWEIRDDMVLNHFVPEFSPVAFNAWLVWATWNRDKMSLEELARHAPPTKLNPVWAPRDIKDYLHYNFWAWHEWTRPNGSKGFLVAVLTVLGIAAVMGLGAAIWLTRGAGKPV